MIEFLQSFNPVTQALFATIFTWLMTLLGAAVAFFGKEVSRKMLDAMLGFAGGVMIAASYWSLLAPAIEMSEGRSLPAWIPAAVGFMLGGVVLRGIDLILPHLHPGFPPSEAEGMHTTWRQTTLLVLAITLHNIPEGLAVGVAFGAAAAGLPSATIAGAISLAIASTSRGLRPAKSFSASRQYQSVAGSRRRSSSGSLGPSVRAPSASPGLSRQPHQPSRPSSRATRATSAYSSRGASVPSRSAVLDRSFEASGPSRVADLLPAGVQTANVSEVPGEETRVGCTSCLG